MYLSILLLHPPRDEFPCRKDKGRHRGQRAYAPRHPTDRMVSNDSFLRPRPRLSLPCGAREEPPSRTRPGEHTPASAAGLRRVYTHPRTSFPPPQLHVPRGSPLGNPLGPRRGACGGARTLPRLARPWGYKVGHPLRLASSSTFCLPFGG